MGSWSDQVTLKLPQFAFNGNQTNISTFSPLVCAICGVLCISLPIPIIVNNFNKFYEKSKIEEEISMKKSKSFQNGSTLNLGGQFV